MGWFIGACLLAAVVMMVWPFLSMVIVAVGIWLAVEAT